jgi:CRP/FNR family transcriptional regulator, anaerobic regulatory protein
MKQLVEDRSALWGKPCTALAVESPACRSVPTAPREAKPEGQRLRFAPHTLIFLEGDRAQRVFQVLDGVVMLYKLLADGRRQVVELLGAGDMFGLAHQAVHDCSAESLVPCSVISFDRAAFERSPDLVRTLNDSLRARMWALREHAMLLGRKSALERVATFLLRCVPNRGGPACRGRHGASDSADVRLAMTRQEIADYLGLTIETVSRAFSELRRRGVLATDKPEEVHINDVCRVCRLTGAH